jgi:two-component system, cell cycle sensor histidine kinase and response regulator CckA
VPDAGAAVASPTLNDADSPCDRHVAELMAEANAARAAAHNAEARCRLLFECASMPAWIVDRITLSIVAVNRAATAVYGYTESEFLALHVPDLYPPNELQRLARSEPRGADGAYTIHGCRHRTRGGTVLDVEINVQPMELDGRAAELVLINDVSSRHRAEADLHRGADLLRAVVDDSPVATVVMDLDMNIERWNAAAERLLGWTAADVIGTCDASMIPGARLAAYRHLRDDVLRGVPGLHAETRRLRKGGTELDVSTSMSVLRDRSGTPSGFVLVMTDVSERKRIETQFRQAQRMEAVGHVAGGVAHDFNNLLTVITGYGQLLQAGLGPDSKFQPDIAEVLRASEKAAKLSRQLVAFSRRGELTPEILALNDVVTGMEAMLRPLVKSEIAMSLALDPALGLVEADRGQIEQVIVNLVVNARDAIQAGGTITVRTSNVTVDGGTIPIGAEPPVAAGDYVSVAVIDTGMGMPPDVQGRVFEPFFTTKPVGEATGLGLPTVYTIARQSRGHVRITSEVGRGTSVEVLLPRAGPP